MTPWSNGWDNLASLTLFIWAVLLLKPHWRGLFPRDRVAWSRLGNKVALALFVVVAVAYLFNLGIYRRFIVADSTTATVQRSLPRVTIDELKSQKVFERRAIHLTELGENVGALLSNKVFVDCDFVGPGIVVLIGSGVLNDNRFDKPTSVSEAEWFDAMVWPINRGAPLVGVFPISGSTINSSNFRNIGFAGDAQFRQEFGQGFRH